MNVRYPIYVLHSFLSKYLGLPFIKKRLQHWSFLVNVAKFLRTPYYEEHLQIAAFVPENITKSESIEREQYTG